jgi:hypothetical protein
LCEGDFTPVRLRAAKKKRMLTLSGFIASYRPVEGGAVDSEGLEVSCEFAFRLSQIDL